MALERDNYGSTQTNRSNRARASEGFSRDEINAHEKIIDALNKVEPALAQSLATIEGRVLLAKDSTGKNVLAHLAEILTPSIELGYMSFNTEIALPTRALDLGLFSNRETLIQDKAGLSPNEIAKQLITALTGYAGSTQDTHGTCATETISMLLQNAAPGEWVRVARGLMEKGEVSIRALNGEAMTLKVPTDIKQQDGSDHRAEVDRRFQAALKNFAPPIAGATYSNANDAYFDKKGTNFGNGVDTEQALKLLNTVMGDSHLYIKDEKIQELLLQQSRRSEPRYAVLAGWPEEGGEEGLHAVALLDVKGEYVHFRNPWGPSATANGTTLNDPRRIVVDNTTGEERMLKSDFIKLLHGVALPKEGLKDLYYSAPEFCLAHAHQGALGVKLDESKLANALQSLLEKNPTKVREYIESAKNISEGGISPVREFGPAIERAVQGWLTRSDSTERAEILMSMALRGDDRVAMNALLKHPTHSVTLKEEVLKSNSPQLVKLVSARVWNNDYYNFALNCLGHNNAAVRKVGFEMLKSSKSGISEQIKNIALKKGFFSGEYLYERRPLKQKELHDLREKMASR